MSGMVQCPRQLRDGIKEEPEGQSVARPITQTTVDGLS